MKAKIIFSMLIFFLLCSQVGLSQTQFRTITYEEALKAAKAEGKQVFIDFYTDWCGPCKIMAKDVFPQPKVGNYFNKNFVCIKLNAEKEGLEQTKQYKITEYPTFIVADADGNTIFELKGAMDAETLILRVSNGIDPNQKPERLAQRYKDGERSPKLVNDYVFSLMMDRKEDQGFAVINDYFKSLTPQQRLLSENLFVFTRYTVSLEDEKAQYLINNAKKFPKESTKQVNDHIQKLLRNAITTYMSGYRWSKKKYDEAAYQDLKKRMSEYGMTKTHNYVPVFKLIESRVKQNDEQFFNECEAQYNALEKSDRDLLIMNFTRLLPTTDKALLDKMENFIRTRLADMPPTTIIMSGHILRSLAEKAK